MSGGHRAAVQAGCNGQLVSFSVGRKRKQPNPLQNVPPERQRYLRLLLGEPTELYDPKKKFKLARRLTLCPLTKEVTQVNANQGEHKNVLYETAARHDLNEQESGNFGIKQTRTLMKEYADKDPDDPKRQRPYKKIKAVITTQQRDCKRKAPLPPGNPIDWDSEQGRERIQAIFNSGIDPVEVFELWRYYFVNGIDFESVARKRPVFFDQMGFGPGHEHKDD